MPWQAACEEVRRFPDDLQAFILCRRHNNALSPVDAAASHAFRRIRESVEHTVKKSLSRLPSYQIIDGRLFELWGLKTLLGMHHAKVSRAGELRTIHDYEFDYALAGRAFYGAGVPHQLGLYIGDEGGRFKEHLSLDFSPMVTENPRVLNGLAVIMKGIRFEFIFDRRGANPAFFEQGRFYRPWVVDLNGRRRSARLFMSWERDFRDPKRVALDIRRS